MAIGRASKTGQASVFHLSAVGMPLEVEAFMQALDPNIAAKSPEKCNVELISNMVRHLPLGTRSARDPARKHATRSKVEVRFNPNFALTANGAFDPSNVFAAYLIEGSGERNLEIECYSEVLRRNIAEHVVIVDGAVTVCETRPLRKSQSDDSASNWGSFRYVFQSRPQLESEGSSIKEASSQDGATIQKSDTPQASANQDPSDKPSEAMLAALEFAKKAQERKRAEGKLSPNAEIDLQASAPQPAPHAVKTRGAPKPPDPWQTHRDDFLATARTAETDALGEKFERQASLLNEVVTPVEHDDTFVRSATIPEGKILIGDNAYVRHMEKVHLNYRLLGGRRFRAQSQYSKPIYDVVCFQVAEKRSAFLTNVCDFGDIPFQGSGGFGIAVVPTNQKRADIDEVFTQIALSQFLDAAPQDLECIVVTRASKLNLKRLQDIEDAGIPIVFDFSGRTSSMKEKVDPLKGLFSKPGNGLYSFNGQLNEKQAAMLGDALDKEALSLMLQALQESALNNAPGYFQARWTDEIIDTLTFGHEKIDHAADGDAAATPAAPMRFRARPGKLLAPWQFSFATFPPESMPTQDSAKAVKRMHDVGVIWHETLKSYGLSLYVEKASGRRRGQEETSCMPDKDKIQEVGKFLGIDTMIDSLYEGVPLDYIM